MEISEYIEQIRNSKTGSEMRAPIANALKAIYEKGADVSKLNGHGASYYLKKSTFKSIADPIDTLPTKNQNGGSNKLVQSRGIYYDFMGSSELEFELPTL